MLERAPHIGVRRANPAAANRHARVPAATFDDELDWILARFVNRLDAAAGAIVRVEHPDRPPALLASTGPWSDDQPLLSLVLAAIGAFPRDRRRGSDGHSQANWTRCEDGACALAVRIAGDDGEAFYFVACYADSRPIEREPATAIADGLAPVLDGYFRLWRRHRAVQRKLAGVSAALDHSALAVVVLDGNAEIVFANRAAERLLENAAGLRRQGRAVAATELGSAVRLQVAIQHVLMEQSAPAPQRGAPVILLPRPGGARPLVCTVLPAAAGHALGQGPAVILYVLDPSSHLGPVVASVCRLYGLSPVETRLAVRLVSGATLAEAAAAMRVKEQTARAYLKQIFSKMGTKRQADLIRILLTSVAHTYGDLEVVALGSDSHTPLNGGSGSSQLRW